MSKNKKTKDVKSKEMEITRTGNLEPGDGILVDGRAWISRKIKEFEEYYRRKILKLPPRKLYSHVAMVIYVLADIDEIGVAEAKSKGIVISRYNNYYKHPRVKYIERIKPLTEEEKKRISSIAYEAAEKITRYDFLGIFHQILLTLTGKWRGKRGEEAEKRLYCSEAFATWHNEICPGIFDEPESVNPLDVDINPNFRAKECQVFGKDGQKLC